jgi:hypothetical protein
VAAAEPVRAVVVPVARPEVPRVVVAEPVPNAARLSTPRGRVAELCGSMAMSAVLAGLLSIFWTALGRSTDFAEIGACFFLTVACCWAVLATAKLWPLKEEDSWARRGCMMVLGLAIGVQALWLDGRHLPQLLASDTAGANDSAGPPSWGNRSGAPGQNPVFSTLFRHHQQIPVAACYLSYFGLAFFALRWWRMADPRRAQRFGLFPLLAAGFWAYLLLFLWPWPEPPRGVAALVMTSAIVQLVSPWQQPPPPREKRLRLRYA